MWCSTSTVIGPVISLLVLLGDPTGRFVDNVVYWLILVMMLLIVNSISIHDYKRMRANKSLSFFKITLHLESKRENARFQKAALQVMVAITCYIFLISYVDYQQAQCEETYYSFYEGRNISVYDCSWADYSQKQFKFYYSGGVNTTLKYDCDSKLLNVSADAPTYPSLNFFLLMFFFLKSLSTFTTTTKYLRTSCCPRPCLSRSTSLLRTSLPRITCRRQRQ